MKILVIGLGSMGKRRVRNFKALGMNDIVGFDLREDRRAETEEKYGIKAFSDFDQAMAEKPAVFIISTPPQLHMKYAHMAADSGIHFFIEASVVDEGMRELVEKLKDKSIVAAPSCTFRFHPSVNKIKELIDKNSIGRLSTFTYHSGQYLPDWHPWEDIRDFYVSQRETGGCREIVPFELTWLTWVFGRGINAIGYKGKTIDLGVDIDDIYHMLLKFENGMVGHMLVDVVSRVPVRRFTAIGDKGVISWDWNEKKVKLFDAQKGNWEIFEERQGTVAEGYGENIIEEMYIDEMKSFLDAAEGKASFPNTLEDDMEVLNILYTMERNADV